MGKPHPIELRQPPNPPASAYVLRWFHQISRGRQIGEYGFGALQWMEIAAWSALTRIRPEPWEIEALLHLDQVWLKVMAEKTYSFEDDKGNDDD